MRVMTAPAAVRSSALPGLFAYPMLPAAMDLEARTSVVWSPTQGAADRGGDECLCGSFDQVRVRLHQGRV